MTSVPVRFAVWPTAAAAANTDYPAARLRALIPAAASPAQTCLAPRNACSPRISSCCIYECTTLGDGDHQLSPLTTHAFCAAASSRKIFAFHAARADAPLSSLLGWPQLRGSKDDRHIHNTLSLRWRCYSSRDVMGMADHLIAPYRVAYASGRPIPPSTPPSTTRLYAPSQHASASPAPSTRFRLTTCHATAFHRSDVCW